MNYAIIENNQVNNIIVLPDDFDGSEFAGKPVVPANDAAIGDGWDGEQFIKAPEPEPEIVIPTTATPAQGLMALYQLKSITEDDIENAIAGIADPAERYAAQIAYRKTTVWEKDSPSMQTIGALLQLTEQDFIDLFTLAPTIKL